MEHPQTISRRDILSAGVGILAAGAVNAPARAARSGLSRATRAPRARNLIFLVTDGMSIGTFTLADMAIHSRTGKASAWTRLWERPDTRRAMVSTRARDSLVTDSAAGGAAWGCGQRLNNGAICWSEQGEYQPILLSARRAGKATGVVSTARVTHATPASFYANVPRRSMEDEIARQLLDRQIDIALGGGARYVSPELLDANPDATVVRTARQLREAENAEGRLIGLFAAGHMAYELDRTEEQPHLRDMAMTAIRRLARNPGGFVLQIEAGRVDHGAHANDFPASLNDQIAFDQTISAVRDWADADGETLVIVTTDHGTGGPDLTVYEEHSHAGFNALLAARHTLSWIASRVAEGPRENAGERLKALVKEHADIELSDDQIEWALRPYNGQRVDAFNPANNPAAALGAVMANHFGVGFISTNHTAEHVIATAFGPGAEALNPMIENFHLHGLMTSALAIPAG